MSLQARKAERCAARIVCGSAKPSERAELDRITSWFNIPDKLCDLYKGLKKFNARWELKKIIAPFSRGLVVDDFNRPFLRTADFVMAGLPLSVFTILFLSTFGYFVISEVMA